MVFYRDVPLTDLQIFQCILLATVLLRTIIYLTSTTINAVFRLLEIILTATLIACILFLLPMFLGRI
jgi:hypothetical protein